MSLLFSPAKSSPILPWAQQATNRLNELTQSGPARMLVRSGDCGSGLEPLPENMRNRTGSNPLSGCWNVISIDENHGGGKGFANKWFRKGQVIYRLDDDTQDTITANLPAEGSVVYAALKVLATDSEVTPTVEWYSSATALQEASLNVNYCLVPLYCFGPRGGVVLDMRALPACQIVEILT